MYAELFQNLFISKINLFSFITKGKCCHFKLLAHVAGTTLTFQKFLEGNTSKFQYPSGFMEGWGIPRDT